jgi:DNA polymerase III sliding clamp (beta) subunit (PCNA family)
MKFSLPRKSFLSVLQKAKSVASGRALQPILECLVIVCTSDNKITVKSSDGVLWSSLVVDCTSFEPGEVAVNAATLLEVVKSLHGEEVTVSHKDKSLELLSGKAKAAIDALIDPRDMPTHPALIKASGRCDIPSSQIASMLSAVVPAASKDTSRMHLCGVQLSMMADGGLKAEAFNGHMATIADSSKTTEVLTSGIIPTKGAEVITRMAGEEPNISLATNGKYLAASVPGSEVVVTMYEGRLPPLDTIIPRSPATTLSLGREVLQEAVRLASIFSRGGGVILNYSSDFSVTSTNEKGKTSTDVGLLASEGKPVVAMVASDYFAAALGAIPDDEVHLGIDSDLGPIVVSHPAEDSAFTVLSMIAGMRI